MMAFVIAQRGLTHSIMRPSREALFTLVPRTDKYAAKNFVDTFVFRGGDALAAKAFQLLQSGLGLSLEALAFVAIPAAAVWGGVALLLGREARNRSK
jgi:AAA family ATP:ADP antiporter